MLSSRTSYLENVASRSYGGQPPAGGVRSAEKSQSNLVEQRQCGESRKEVRKEAVCSVCRMVFKRKYDLTQHMNAVHYKLRPFKCPRCALAFAHKGTLSKHVRTVHYRERPFVCEHCHQRFSERGNVNKHKQRSESCRAKENAGKGKEARASSGQR